MSWEDDINIYNDPIVFLNRKGDSKSPYKIIRETVEVINGKAVLREVPERLYRVSVTGNSSSWYEVENEELTSNCFQVDYIQGVVFFHAANSGLSLTFEYTGKGAYYAPDSRVYLTKPDGFIQTANEKFDDLDRADLEQKNRVDTLIIENPQPSEVVDLRIDRNGVVFPVARDRINAEQKKIEEAYEDLNGYEYPTLKDRIDAEQFKIEEAYADKNGKAFGSLKERIDAEQTKIEDAYVDKNGVKFNSLKERIDAEQKKIEDAYTDKNGLKYTSLKGRIDGEQTKIEDLMTLENEFDISKLEPFYICHLNGIRNAVNQSVNIDPVTGQIFTTQSDSKSPEGFYINKLSPSGDYISSMWLPEAGHGTTIGLDRKTNGSLKIWLYHEGLSKLILIDYKDFTSITKAQASNYMDYTPASLQNVYFTPSFDHNFDYLVLRRSDGRVEIRSHADVATKIDKILYYCDIDTSENTKDVNARPMQGISTYGKDIYWQSGASNNTMKIQKYDGETHKKVLDVNFSNLMAEDGIMLFRDGFHEPEGMCYYVNPKTGKHSILFAISTGGITKRYTILYALNQRNASDHWDSVARVGSPTYQFTKGERALSILDGMTKLSSLTKPGIYYIDNDQAKTFTDFPYPVGDAGWFVEVSPLNQTMDGRQKLIRFSTVNKILVMERSFTLNRENFTYSFGNWTIHTSNSDHQEYLAASDWGYKLSNVRFPAEYYLTVPQMTAFTDAPYKDAGARLIVRAGDADGKVRQEIIRNSDSILETYVRNVDDKGATTAWYYKRLTGALDYSNITVSAGVTASDTNSLFRVANDGSYLIFRGALTIPSTITSETVFATIPNSWKPTMRWDYEQENCIFTFKDDGTISVTNTSGSNQTVRPSTLVPIW
jgi:hypothetical protein